MSNFRPQLYEKNLLEEITKEQEIHLQPSNFIRKPDSGISECRKLLEALTPDQRAKIIIHDYPELYKEFSLKGIHVNKNVPSLPSDYKGYRTRSCHSLEEVQRPNMYA